MMTAARSQKFAIGAESDTIDIDGVPLEVMKFLARVRIPDFDGSAIATRGQAFSVRAEGNVPHFLGVTGQVEKFLSCGRVPDFDGFVMACGGEADLASCHLLLRASSRPRATGNKGSFGRSFSRAA